MELEVRRAVYGKSGDFAVYNLKIGKTWNGYLSSIWEGNRGWGGGWEGIVKY